MLLHLSAKPRRPKACRRRPLRASHGPHCGPGRSAAGAGGTWVISAFVWPQFSLPFLEQGKKGKKGKRKWIPVRIWGQYERGFKVRGGQWALQISQPNIDIFSQHVKNRPKYTSFAFCSHF